MCVKFETDDFCVLIFNLILLFISPISIIFYLFILVFRIYLFTRVIIHCVCPVSVECKVLYGNKNIVPV